jgi:hypothetical protein
MIHRLEEIGVPLPSKTFKGSKNGSVLKNEVKYIRIIDSKKRKRVVNIIL